MADKNVKPAALIGTTELPPGAPISLRDAVYGLLGSVLQARVFLDQQTALLARQYQGNELLAQFQPTGLGIAEVTLRLPYAAVDVRPTTPNDPTYKELGSVPQVLVQVNSDQLARLPEHAVASVELKLTESQLALLFPGQ
ncbi:MAG TPA: hypothetical protein VK191_03675 [Symbiobacteriaceae bacterium]|nr:hypothetical protein [Symbiobacteriaceae bacterium]